MGLHLVQLFCENVGLMSFVWFIFFYCIYHLNDCLSLIRILNKLHGLIEFLKCRQWLMAFYSSLIRELDGMELRKVPLIQSIRKNLDINLSLRKVHRFWVGALNSCKKHLAYNWLNTDCIEILVVRREVALLGFVHSICRIREVMASDFSVSVSFGHRKCDFIFSITFASLLHNLSCHDFRLYHLYTVHLFICCLLQLCQMLNH